MMISIASTAPIERNITLINVFTVTPEKQATAATKITEIYQNFVCKQPGFVAAEIQKRLDGTTVSAIASDPFALIVETTSSALA